MTDRFVIAVITLVRKVLCLLALLPVACSHAELTPGQYANLIELIHPSEVESAWLEIDWEVDLWKARERAAREDKPIFLWEMDGHPLGCT